MKDWQYRELVDIENEDIEDFEQDPEMESPEQVVSKTIVEALNVTKNGYTESVIVYSIIGKYMVEKCSTGYLITNKEKFMNVLGVYERSKLDGSLTEEEMEELEETIKFVLKGFKERTW